MKRAITFVLAAVLVTGLVGCAGNGSENGDKKEAKNDTVEITVMHDEAEEERIAAKDEMIKKFEAENPGIKVIQEPVSESAFETKVKTLISAGELPALVAGSNTLMQMLDEEAVSDTAANKEVFDQIGADSFYDSIPNFLQSQSSDGYISIPVTGWVSGIWYRTDVFEEKGLEVPNTWENILAAAKALHDPGNKKYGIMISTEEGAFTQQTFQQFALSNGADLFDSEGKPIFDSKEMREAIEFYNELYQYSLPGSNGTTQVRDAMVGENTSMCVFSSYVLPALYKQGVAENIGFAIPENKVPAAAGGFTNYTIADGLSDGERDAAKKFLAFMLEEEINIDILHTSPGGANPVLKSVAGSPAYLENEIVKAYESIAQEIPAAFNNMQQFGLQDGKLNPYIGTISQKFTIGKAINQILVQGADIDETIAKTQEELDSIVK